MTTPVWLTGFEHGVATPTINGAGLFNTVNGSPTIQSTTKKTGAYALKCAGTNVAANVVRNVGANSNLVARLYIRFNTLPTGAGQWCEVLKVTTGTGNSWWIEYDRDSGKLQLENTFGLGASTNTISANTWYRIDVKLFCGGTTWTGAWQIDGVDQTGLNETFQTTTTFNTGIQIGTSSSAATFDVYIDDIVLSQTAGDYPIGAGGTEALIPVSDGTHNAGTNVMENQAGADIGVVAAFSLIDDIPMSLATEYIRQAPIGTGNYAEVQFGNIAASHSAIIGAFGILAYTSATTTGNTGGCILSKDDFSTSTTLWGAPGALADMSDGSLTSLFYKSVRLTGVVDDATVNALEARVGYSGDATPDPYWVNLLVEVAYVSGPADLVIACSAGALSLADHTAALIKGAVTVSCGAAGLNEAGLAAELFNSNVIVCGGGALALSAQGGMVLPGAVAVACTAGGLGLSEQAGTVFPGGVTVSCVVENMSLEGNTGAAATVTTIACGSGVLGLLGMPGGVLPGGVGVVCGAGALGVNEHGTSILPGGVTISCLPGGLNVNGYNITVYTPASGINIACLAAALNLLEHGGALIPSGMEVPCHVGVLGLGEEPASIPPGSVTISCIPGSLILEGWEAQVVFYSGTPKTNTFTGTPYVFVVRMSDGAE